MRTIMVVDPIFVIAAITAALMLLGLHLIGRRLRHEFLLDQPTKLSASVVNDYQSALDAMLAIAESALTVDEAADALMLAFSNKKGRRDDPAWMQVIEEAESKVRQPQRYHAVETDEGWIVASVEDGVEVIHVTYAGETSEADARRTAVVKNLVLQESRDMEAELEDWRAQHGLRRLQS